MDMLFSHLIVIIVALRLTRSEQLTIEEAELKSVLESVELSGDPTVAVCNAIGKRKYNHVRLIYIMHT